jgi:UTP--glucose-1-phosphate uridylyltransferase
VIEDHFDRNSSWSDAARARQEGRARVLARRSRGRRDSFTRQQSPLGLGHAVWCARELVGASRSRCCCPTCWCRQAELPRADGRRLQRAGEAANIIAVEEVPKDQVSSYGVVGVGERKASRSASPAW